MDTVKEFLTPKRFGMLAYVCLIVYSIAGTALFGVALESRNAEFAKFGCDINKQSTAAYKASVEKTCYSRYEQAYNSPLPLYSYVLLSVVSTILVSIIYSLVISARVEEIDRSTNRDDATRADSEETEDGVYVFYFYLFHLVVRSIFGTLFTVLQHTAFYPKGFDLEFTCNLPTSDLPFQKGNDTLTGKLNYTSISCKNPTALEKRLWSVIISVLNSVACLITLGEVIYLICRWFRILCCRSEIGLGFDTQFVTVYLLHKQYVRTERRLSSIGNAAPLLGDPGGSSHSAQNNTAPDNTIPDSCFDQYLNLFKKQVLSLPRSSDICYAQKTDLNDIYIDFVIHTERALRLPKFSQTQQMSRHEIYNIYMKVPESSIRLHEIKDLFYPNEDTKGYYPSTILTVGRPGIGKTVLAEKILQDWANGTDDFYCGKILFFFKFRWLNFEEFKNVSLKMLLSYGMPGFSEEKFEGIFVQILKEPERAIFIFDGLDEFRGDMEICLEQSRIFSDDPHSCMPGMTLFIKLACGSMLQRATLLVTSRPTTEHFYSKLTFDRSVEIIGFTSDKVEDYVSKFCENMDNPDLKAKIWNHIKSSPDVLNLCYIPVNCFVVCVTLFGCLNEDNDTGALPTTLTELYTVAINHFAKKHNRNSDQILCKEVELDLQEQAFYGIENGQLVFSEQIFDEQMKNSGLVNSLSNPIFPVQTQYCFIHLTIQEFLAARYIIGTFSPEEIVLFISDHIKDGEWHLVLQFIAGLLRKKLNILDAVYHSCVMAYTTGLTLIDNFIDFDYYGNVLVMKCLQETDDVHAVKKACDETGLKTVTGISHYSKTIFLSASDWSAVTFVCKNLKNLMFLRLVESLGEDNCCLEVTKLLEHTCLQTLAIVNVNTVTSELQHKQLIGALMNSKCNFYHEHRQLHALTLRLGMNDECASNLSAFIEHGYASDLNELVLKDNKITSVGMSKLSGVLSDVHCSKLTNLNLSFNPIGDEGASLLCKGLIEGHCKLKNLYLDFCSLTKKCIGHLCEMLCDEKCELTELSLIDNAIGDEGVRVLCTNALRGQCLLTTLFVCNCDLTDDCVECLWETLKDRNCNVIKFVPYGNNFSQESYSLFELWK